MIGKVKKCTAEKRSAILELWKPASLKYYKKKVV